MKASLEYHPILPITHNECNDDDELKLLRIAELLPHGSGFDDTWYCTMLNNGSMVFESSFHKMNEWGYIGWVPVKLRLYGKDNKQARFYCSDPDLREYAGDEIAYCLEHLGLEWRG